MFLLCLFCLNTQNSNYRTTYIQDCLLLMYPGRYNISYCYSYDVLKDTCVTCNFIYIACNIHEICIVYYDFKNSKLMCGIDQSFLHTCILTR